MSAPKNLTAGDLSAAAAVVEVRAATAGAARASLLALAERLRGVAIPEAVRGDVLDLGEIGRPQGPVR